MKVSKSPSVTLYNEDCITGMRSRLAPESIDLVVSSIPFEELFTYSGKTEDVGNNGSTIDIRTGRFALNMRFVVDALWHVMKPGCNACIHIQQLLAYRCQHGFMGRRDFRGAMIDVFTRGGAWAQHMVGESGDVFPITMPALNPAGQGFHFVGEFVVPKNPQSMAQRLNLHSLQFKTGHTRNACNLAPAPNDYVLIFQKPGESRSPVRSVSYKSKNPRGWVTEEDWINWASGVWSDVLEIDVLDGSRGHKEEKHEKHVCPLQLEVIRRLVALYTNPIAIQPDVTVLDPFMGIGSTAYVAAGGVSPVTKRGLAEPRNVGRRAQGELPPREPGLRRAGREGAPGEGGEGRAGEFVRRRRTGGGRRCRMSSQTHRDRLAVLHHLAQLGSATTRTLATAAGITFNRVARALAHRWFEVAPTEGRGTAYRLSTEGQAAERSAGEGGAG